MNDSERHDGQTDVFPVSDLTRRILRRATEPVGVIDVRHAAELHSRSRLWPGRRLELLDNLKSRYGPDQGAAGAPGIASPVAGGMFFVVPPQRMAATGAFDLAPASAGVSHGGMPAAAGGTVSKASSESSAPQYRVKRPDRHAERNAPEPLAETAAARSPAADAIGVSTISIPVKHLQRQTSDMQSRPSGTPGSSALTLARAAAVGTPERLDNKPAPGPDVSHTIGPLPQVSELPRIAIAAQMHLRRKPDDSAAAGKIGPFPAPHRPRPASTREELPGEDAPTSNGSLTAGPLPQVSALPRAAIDAPMHLQRAADQSPMLPVAGLVQTAEPITAPPRADNHSQSRGAVAAEIRVAPSPADATRIVWRKPGTNGASRESATPGPTGTVGPTRMNGPQIMRQAAAEPVSGGDAAPVATAASGDNGADVMRIAEQVGRIIERQLRVERERRGIR